ncbi:small nuclear ribonucleoprotein [Tremella mesenterica]|uniref:Small nuclear ribonucleoprotein n=1 Tax=Tremella mesenterica TaxID=5217 RepID=A0A4Q1BPV7_TREME|nr:uncharacterized protein TREMEDRAFT_45982 [Tremella mesenterica DSM 1558]EIW65997.1 hypothetical protein TREMEDRAFT_45982 [Tremella mesenterica DSM 1558]RXK39923.1 small nuclear ribonucleoprotein [Tremella mesenterica]
MGKMAEVQRRLLEQMMGPEAMGVAVINYDWWDDKVCRNYLFGTCPHNVFSNTKMDLGSCPKIHSDRILEQFKEAQAADPDDPRIASYKREHENNLYSFVEECDRRIRASQRKLEKTPEENRKTVDLMREIGEIELSIQGATEEVEALGEAGKVEESMEKLKAVDALKSLKTDKERELQVLNENAGASGHQKLRVCETCGAMLSVLDSDKRLADHFGGKLHLGYHELRKLLAQMAEDRMIGRQSHQNPSGPPPSAPSAPSGPRQTHLGPPGGPGLMGPPGIGNGAAPHTPMHPRVPPVDEMPLVGHGDKIRREAGELEEDLKEVKGEREREERHVSSKYRDRDRDDRHERYREKDGYDKYDRREDRDRGESHRSRDRDRDGERDRDRDRSSKYDKYDENRDREKRHRSREKERSRSPPKRRLV